MRFSRVMTVVLLLLAGACTAAFSKDIFVATNGNDTTGDGTIAKPYATLGKATSVAVAGDNIYLRAGTYVQHRYWDTGGDGAAGQYITISAYDGDLSAVFQADNTGMDAICFHARHYVKLIGLEVKAGSNIVHVDGGSQYIYVQRCYVHDASQEGDCIKVNQCDYVYVESTEVARPGARSGGGYQEGIDFVDVDFSAQRDNYVHDFGDMALYTKGGSENTIIERNVVSHQLTNYGNPATGFGQQTDSPLMDGATYQSYNCVYRNNLIRDSAMGAIGTYDCYHGYFYNNTVHNCGDSSHGIVHQRASTTPESPKSTGVYFFNNVFLDTAGDMWTVYQNRSGTYEDWQTGNNNYYNNGSPVPSSGLVNPNTESGATFGNPSLSNPTGTATTRQGWVNCYRITASSAALIDHGNTSAGNTPYPAVAADIEGVSRPQGGGYDIGASEYPSAPVPPVANFTGNPTSGPVPLTVAFTDTSSGSPTSWSWTFGDGGSSTAQHPSHVYTTANSYTVSLTATNAQGSDGETKTNYITATPAQITIFSDNFESAFSGWTLTRTPDWYTGTPKNGTHSIQFRGTSTSGIDEAIARTISTVGYQNIVVSFSIGGHSLDSASEYLIVEWYNGSAWTEIMRVKGGDAWNDRLLHAYTSATLASGANNNASFQLRFALYGSATNDYGYVDDVVVKGATYP